MTRVYILVNDREDKSWQHEWGHRLLKYAMSLPENRECQYGNISHSGRIVAAAASEKQVGVDIEYIRPVKDISRKALTEKEKDWVRENPEAGILTMWTLKESYGKAYRFGIAYPMRATEFLLSKSSNGLNSFECSDKAVTCYNKLFYIGETECTLSVCIRSVNAEAPQLKVLQQEEIL